ncbi:TPD1 protein homolog 1-like [Telopea speciosissima]|uniref:TPD1 protein homolog 1-like n=1 Tax=Telopea speciosissima TaxID=54955 RepID=UPI001CC4D509|nr:TPD1 protein homolog 1-like [Telopea speciosissima]
MAAPAALRTLFCATLILLLAKGSVQCTLDDIDISQDETGKQVEGKPEYKVTVNNECECTHWNLTLSCPGFNTVEKVDPLILRPNGSGSCLLKNGTAFYGFASLSFTYAWETPTSFTPESSNNTCPGTNRFGFRDGHY